MTGAMRSARWLASACDDPAGCLREWRVGPRGVVLLPAGRMRDALAVPEILGRGLLAAIARSRRSGSGPVLGDSRCQELVLLMTPGTPPPTGLDRAARYLTSGAWPAVPDPDRQATGPAWLVAPDGCGTLCSPTDVSPLLPQHPSAK
ncbi:hypothetical protein SAMN05428939_1586 [Streptomyces sp. TLI_105]|nr:hypothetical protein SAMN05428939_1586 [Streptomyces sp. TLI_105]